jgi:hypothetical protein
MKRARGPILALGGHVLLFGGRGGQLDRGIAPHSRCDPNHIPIWTSLCVYLPYFPIRHPRPRPPSHFHTDLLLVANSTGRIFSHQPTS